MKARFMAGEEVVIVRSAYKCASCGQDHSRYYHGGQLDNVGLQSQGIIIEVASEDKFLLRLEDGREQWLHPDEINFLEKDQLAKLKRIFPGINSLPRHPVFEIAEQSPVFLVNDRVYSIGGGKVSDGKDYFENTKIIRSRRSPLVEVGDFASLDALVLDRASKEIERIGENYARDAQRKLNVLRILSGDLDLDTPQLIYKFIFPYLHNGQYGDKVSELLGVEEIRGTSKSPEQKAKVTKRLEQIADEVGIEVRNLIGQIEQEGQKPTERTKKQSRLDVLFDYEESKPYTGTSLLGRAINGRNVAIVDGIVYDLITGRAGQKQHVQVDGQRFSLIEREGEKLEKRKFGKGAKVRIRGDSEYAGQNKGVGTMKEDFSKGGEEHRSVKFDDGHDNSYRIKDLEFVEEVLERGEQLSRGLEERFLTELEKKIRVDALRQHLSRDKIIDLLRTQDAELLAMAGRKEYQGEGFGFVQDGEENYYAYIEVPAFAIKSQFDSNYYFFDRARIGTRVWKNGKGLSYDQGESMGESGLVAVDNNNHPFLHNRKENFARFCIGRLDFPTSGQHNGEVVVKRLRRCREMVMFGYRGDSYAGSYMLTNNGYFEQNRIELEKLEKMGVPIIQGGSRQ